jgi:integrase
MLPERLLTEGQMARALTAAAVERLRADSAKRREIADGLQPGLYLVIQPEPSAMKSWAVRFRLDGKPQKFTIGQWPTFDLASARREARKALQLVAQGVNPTRAREAQRRAEASDDTFEAMASKWIEREHRRPGKRAWVETARLIGLRPDPEDEARLLVIPGSPVDHWRRRKPADVVRRDVVAVLDEIADRAPIAANRTQSTLRTFFNWAIARGEVTANPVVGIEPREERARDRVLDDAELLKVWLAASGLDRLHGAIVRLLILTGARREEIAGLRWAEIKEDRIELPGNRTKNGQPHIIPLLAPALGILKGLHSIHGSPFVFTTTGTTPVGGFSRIKARLDTLSGVEGWVVHDLRRTVATGLQRLGVRLEVTEAVLGHTSGSRGGIVGIYQRHNWADEKRQALDAWARHVVELVEGRPAPAAKVVELRPGWAS